MNIRINSLIKVKCVSKILIEQKCKSEMELADRYLEDRKEATKAIKVWSAKMLPTEYLDII